jgi:hypothetical protein
MKVRTLAEAAADVLAKSRAAAPSEPMPSIGAEVVDLGGSTQTDPSGGDVGSRAAAAVGTATPPGTPPAADSKEGMKKLAQEEAEVSEDDVEGTETIAEDEVEDEEIFEEMTAEEVEAAYAAKVAMLKEKLAALGSKEDIDAIFSGEELSEEFRTKVSTIFEGAVIARAVQVIEEMESEILAAAEETIEEVKQELEEQVDTYLNYMVNEWVQENEVAVDSGLKTEIMEEFMAGLKNLFAEHYIDVPEEKVDVLEAMAEEIDELKGKLNESLNDNISLALAITEARKAEIIASVCEGLTATQSEKVKTLAEGVEFTTEGEYEGKIKIIRESYFNQTASDTKTVKQASNPIAITESAEPVVTSNGDVSPSMDSYVKALSRTNPV